MKNLNEDNKEKTREEKEEERDNATDKRIYQFLEKLRKEEIRKKELKNQRKHLMGKEKDLER